MPTGTDMKYAVTAFPGKGLTYSEWHAAVLGLIGVFAGAGVPLGYQTVVGLGTLALLGLIFALRIAPSHLPVAGRLVRREPWYFTTVYVLTATAGYAALSVMG
ncbi:MAG: hypothetical protein ABEJ86_03655 [Halococcoides sp.]